MTTVRADPISDVDGLSFNELKTFTVLGTPLLSEGKSADLLALAPQLWIHGKVYAAGGERQIHRHPKEDHAFFILSGKATFRNAENEETEVGPFGGIMIPRGVLYSFENSSDENLVILRIGAGEESGGMRSSRKAKGALESMRTEGPDGGKLIKDLPTDPVIAPGKFFTAP